MAKQEALTETAWAALSEALGVDLPLIRAEVDSGRSVLISWGNGEFFTVLRDEVGALGKELVIVAAAGRNSMAYMDHIRDSAKAQGYASIRAHTMRPDAMLRMTRHWGTQRAETVIRAVL